MKSRSFAEVAVGAVVLLVAASFLMYAVTSSGRSLAASGDGLTLRARFERIDGINVGSDVRIAGVRVGSVLDARIDPETFLAVLTLRLNQPLRLPTDTSAEITSEGLLGGRFISLVPGGSERIFANNAMITNTQGAISLEALLGRFIFSAGESGSRGQQETPQQQPAPTPAPQPGTAR